LIWAGFRFCQLEAAGATLILFSTAIWGTIHGYGTFLASNLTDSLILLDSFIAVIGTMTLVVAAFIVGQRNANGEILKAEAVLHEAAERKNRDLIVTVRALEVQIAGRGASLVPESEEWGALSSGDSNQPAHRERVKPE